MMSSPDQSQLIFFMIGPKKEALTVSPTTAFYQLQSKPFHKYLTTPLNPTVFHLE